MVAVPRENKKKKHLTYCFFLSAARRFISSFPAASSFSLYVKSRTTNLKNHENCVRKCSEVIINSHQGRCLLVLPCFEFEFVHHFLEHADSVQTTLSVVEYFSAAKIPRKFWTCVFENYNLNPSTLQIPKRNFTKEKVRKKREIYLEDRGTIMSVSFSYLASHSLVCCLKNDWNEEEWRKESRSVITCWLGKKKAVSLRTWTPPRPASSGIHCPGWNLPWPPDLRDFVSINYRCEKKASAME